MALVDIVLETLDFESDALTTRPPKHKTFFKNSIFVYLHET